MQESGTPHEIMSNRDALMFPLIASCALFGLYVFFQFFSKEYINLLLTGYFFFLGVLALSHLLRYTHHYQLGQQARQHSYLCQLFASRVTEDVFI